uniref:Uncharacterized protein n=1 Tax=Caenorhabditis japonica TaxID=281687 RepID=A0A8R1IA98_CAEJA
MESVTKPGKLTFPREIADNDDFQTCIVSATFSDFVTLSNEERKKKLKKKYKEQEKNEVKRKNEVDYGSLCFSFTFF